MRNILKGKRSRMLTLDLSVWMFRTESFLIKETFSFRKPLGSVKVVQRISRVNRLIRSFGGYNRNAEKRFLGTIKEDQRLNPGDIIMGVTDMTSERRLVGHVAVVPDLGEEMTLSMDLIKLIPKRITKSYLYSILYYGKLSKQISPLANGVNVLHLKPESIMNISMLVPNQEVLCQYDELYKPINRKIEVLQNQCNSAQEARDRLLPKLMSGEMEV